jgi:hypothetical protein
MTRLQRLLHARIWILLACMLALIVGTGILVRESTVDATAAAHASGATR